MELFITLLMSVLATAGVGGTLLLYQNKKNLENKLKAVKSLDLTEDEAIKRASTKAENIIIKAEKEAQEFREKNLEQARKTREELEAEDKRIDEREHKLIDRAKVLDSRFEAIANKEKSLEDSRKYIENVRHELNTRLEKISQMSKEEAKKLLMSQTEEDLKNYVATKIKESENQIQNTVDDKAKDLLIDSMQNSASDYVAETTTTTIDIESEELKGKIIGKEGRNIRTFERLTGVDIIVDEAPNQVTLSCFDPIRREVASLALQKLLKDGRVHPGSIEETIREIKNMVAKEIKKTPYLVAQSMAIEPSSYSSSTARK